MKEAATLLFSFLLVCTNLNAQVIDNFNDGDFTQNPTWVGDTGKFIVNTSFQLQLDDTSNTPPAYLSIPSSSIRNASWFFYFDLDFDPSSSNYGRVYLTSDKENLTGSLNGYFVQIGGVSGTVDDVSLFKQTGNSDVKIIDGVDGTVGTSPSGLVRVTRDSLGQWELFLDTSSTQSGFISQGTVVDGTFPSSSYFGFYADYTSTRSDKFFFDSVSVTGGVYPDTTKPTVQQLTVLNALSMEINFSEQVDPGTALDLNNYSWLDLPTTPTTVTFQGTDSSTVELVFGSSFPNGQSGSIEFKGIEDLAGNTIVTDTITFFYGQPDTVALGDVYINEFIPDPNPVVALPDAEFVELYNASNKLLSTRGWTFEDASSAITLPDVFFPAGSYLILCERVDSADFAAFGRVLAVSSLPALNNSGDDLALRDSSGNLLHEVSYTSAFYSDQSKAGGGVSLELIFPGHPCATGADNWDGSNSLDGGTPGYVNSIFDTTKDVTPPEIQNIEIIGDTSLKIVFDETIKVSSLSTATYYLIFDVVDSLKRSDWRIDSTFSTGMIWTVSGIAKGLELSFGVEGVADCWGNVSGRLSQTIWIPREPLFGNLIINEIHAKPDKDIKSLPEGEYVEIFNRSFQTYITLEGVELRDATSSGKVDGVVIAPQEYVILCAYSDVSDYNEYGRAVGVSSFPSLNNAGDDISLHYGDVEIDRVEYSDQWYESEESREGGVSLERIDPYYICPTEVNWHESTDSRGGTPGSANSVRAVFKDSLAPRVTKVSVVQPQSIRLYHSEYSKKPSVTIAPSISIDTVLDYGSYSDVIIAQFLKPKTIYEISVVGLEDCSENRSTRQTFQFGLPEEANEGDIAINELLFNPLNTSGSDYIELVNTSEKIIDLKGWYFANYDAEDDTLENFDLIASEPLQWLPGKYLTFMTDSNDVLSVYPVRDESTFIQLPALPSWSNSEGTAALLDSSGAIVDRFDYSEEMHFPLLNDNDGVSLERIDLNQPTNTAENWHSAAETVGFGTPGCPNSQIRDISEAVDYLSVEPSIFSPDNDGFEDVLPIVYNVKRAGFVGTITILDAQGRLIRILEENTLLEPSGQFIWDGVDEDGRKAPIGMYLVVFEAFHQDGTQIQARKPATLAAPMR